MASKQTGLTAESLMLAQQKMIASGKLTDEQLKVAQEQLAKLQELVNAFKAETVATQERETQSQQAIEQITETKKDSTHANLSDVRDEVKNLTLTIEGKEPKPGRAPLPKISGRKRAAATDTDAADAMGEDASSKEQIQKIGKKIRAGDASDTKGANTGGGFIEVVGEKILADIEKSRSPMYEKLMDLFMSKKPSAAAVGTSKFGDFKARATLKDTKAAGTGTGAQVINITAKSVNLKGPINISTAAVAEAASKSGGRHAEASVAPAVVREAERAQEDGGLDLGDIAKGGIKKLGRGVSAAGRMLRAGVGKLGRGIMGAGRGIMAGLGGGAGLFAGGSLLIGAGSAAATAGAQNKMFEAAKEGDYQQATNYSRRSSLAQMGAMGEFADPMQQQEAADKEARDALKAQADSGNKKAAEALKNLDRPLSETNPELAAKIEAGKKQAETLKSRGFEYSKWTGKWKKAGTGFLGFGGQEATAADMAPDAAQPASKTASMLGGSESKPAALAGPAAVPASSSIDTRNVGMSGIPVSVYSSKKLNAAVQANSSLADYRSLDQASKNKNSVVYTNNLRAADVAAARSAEVTGRLPTAPSGLRVESASLMNAGIKAAPAAPIIVPVPAGHSNTVNNTTNNIMPRADVRPNESAMERYISKQSHFI